MFASRNSSLLKQHTQKTNHSLCFAQFSKAYSLVTQLHLLRNVLLVNNGLLVNSSAPFRNMDTQGWPQASRLTNYVSLLWVEVGQPWPRSSNCLSSADFPTKNMQIFFPYVPHGPPIPSTVTNNTWRIKCPELNSRHN
jgi:hypothetical protein